MAYFDLSKTNLDCLKLIISLA